MPESDSPGAFADDDTGRTGEFDAIPARGSDWGSAYPSIAPQLSYQVDPWHESIAFLEGSAEVGVWTGVAAVAALAALGVLLLGIFHVVWSSGVLTLTLTTACVLGSAGSGLNAVYLRMKARERFLKAEPRGYGSPEPPQAPQGPVRPELQELIAVNRADMGSYQKLTRDQATTSYRWSLAALGAGLVVLVGGIVVVISAKGTTDKAAVAGLTAISGALTSFVASTYLRIYERTLQQLNYYFQQPLVASYLLTAERVTESVARPARKDDVRVKIVEQALEAASRPGEPNTGPDAAGVARIATFRRSRRTGGADATPEPKESSPPATQP